MLVNDFDFDLPKKLIANKPVDPRDYAKLLVYNRNDYTIKYDKFFNLDKYLSENDVLIFNNSKVLPARIVFPFKNSFAELLLLEFENGLWKALVKPGKKFKIGEIIECYDIKFIVKGIIQNGIRLLDTQANYQDVLNLMLKNGEMPIPPYISGKDFINEDYNTVYAKYLGSVAAPTAGLHFTNSLINKLQSKGICIEFVTLHVGLGTFLPIKTEDTKFHIMHSENYFIDYFTADRLNKYKKSGKNLISVGTTSARVLEDNFAKFGKFQEGNFSTNIFIEPGYQWKAVNSLITNFHLPKSTLLMLVASLIGKDNLLKVYKNAIKNELRFFSFGDGMLIL